MNKITHLTPHFAVTGALAREHLVEAAAMGFKSIVSNLPDGESAAYPTSRQEAELAANAGLGFRHIPATKADIFSDRVVEGTTEALSVLEGPILAHCASGLRSAIAWAAAAARVQSPDRVLETLQAAGFNLDAIRDELVAQHDPQRTGAIAPALDASPPKS
jgi:sulfide:quinone oxidoreductase